MPSDPRQPFVDLALVAPRFLGDQGEGFFDVHHQVAGVRAGHVAVVGVEDHRRLHPARTRLVGDGIFAEEGVRHVDHVRHAPHGLGHRDVVRMHAGEGVQRQRRAEQIIRLELADRSPQGREQIGGEHAAGFLERLAVRLAQQLEGVAPELRARLLFGEAHAGGLLTGTELVPGTAVGADDDLALELRAEPAPPELEGPGGDELEVVEMGVDVENAHRRKGWRLGTGGRGLDAKTGGAGAGPQRTASTPSSWMLQNRPSTDPVCVMRMNLAGAAGKLISVTGPLPLPVATGAPQDCPSPLSSTL